jgi:ribosomal-protein-alanine N-acetyltransferase
MKSMIRWMTKEDVKHAIKIDKESPDPWLESDFAECLKPWGRIGKIIEVDGKVVGYMLYELMNERFYLINIAVSELMRRRGLGRTLVKQLIDKLENGNRTIIDIHISEDNLVGHLFFKSLGFRAISVDRDFFRESGKAYDAYLFSYGSSHQNLGVGEVGKVGGKS